MKKITMVMLSLLVLVGAGCAATQTENETNSNTNQEAVAVTNIESVEEVLDSEPEDAEIEVTEEDVEVNDVEEASEEANAIDTSDWNTYAHKETGFRFQYPSEWSEKQIIEGDDLYVAGFSKVHFRTPEQSKRGDVGGTPAAVALTYSQNGYESKDCTLEESEQLASMSDLSIYLSQFEYSETPVLRCTSGLVDAYKYAFMHQYSGIEGVGHYFVLNLGNNEERLTISVDVEIFNEEEDYKVLQELIHTFSINSTNLDLSVLDY